MKKSYKKFQRFNAYLVFVVFSALLCTLTGIRLIDSRILFLIAGIILISNMLVSLLMIMHGYDKEKDIWKKRGIITAIINLTGFLIVVGNWLLGNLP